MGMLLKSAKPFYGHHFTIIKYFSLVAVLLLLFLPFYFNLQLGIDVILAVAGAYLLLALAFALYIKIVNDAIVYTLTDQEVAKDEGIIQKKHVAIPYAKISNIAVKRGLLDRFFNLGSIYVDATGGGAEYEIVMQRLKLKELNAMIEIIQDLVARQTQQPQQGAAPSAGPEEAGKKEAEKEETKKPAPVPLPRLYALGEMGKDRLDELEYMAYSRQSGLGAETETEPEPKNRKQRKTNSTKANPKRK